MSTDTERFAVQLRASLAIDGLHSGLEPATVLASSRRSRRRRNRGLTLGGIAAGAAVAVAAATLPGVLMSSPTVAPAGPTGAPAVSAGKVVTLAAGVTAASAVTGDGSAWSTGLAVRTPQSTDLVTLVAGTAAALDETTAGTGVRVDHALRVVVGSADAPTASFLVAWSDVRESPAPTSPASGRSADPSAVTLYDVGEPGLDAGGLPVASRVMAGIVPAWLSGAHVVFFSPGGMTGQSGNEVHAVEVPTFADPTGSGARVYLAVADSQVPVGQRPRGIFYVTDDGTFVDVDGTCALARQTPACDGERPDGLDLTAELLSAIR